MHESLSLTQPWLLWGLLAAGLPVLIHLLLRPRPRRLRFPALALMRATLVSGQRASRLRNLLLLLLRMALLACAALLLAGPTCAPRAGDRAQSGPVACVIALDDSLSTQYRPRFDDQTTLLDQLRRQVVDTLEASAAWPAGSELAVVRAGGGNETAALTANRALLIRSAQTTAGEVSHARPLGPALADAARLLRSAPQPQRQLVVATDLTAAAWRDVRPAILAGIDELSVRVIGPPQEARTNLAVAAATLPPAVYPASASVPVRVLLRAAGAGGEGWLVARQNGNVLARVGPLALAADAAREVTLRLPPLPPGPHAATLAFEPDDALPFDQARYIVWQTGPQPEAWLLTTVGGGPARDLSILIYRNLLAPEALSPEQQRVALRIVRAEEVEGLLARPGGAAAAERVTHPPGEVRSSSIALLIVVPDVPLSAAAHEGLLRAVEGGGTLLLVPASRAAVADWPGLRSLLSEASPVEEEIAPPTMIRWEPGASSAAGDDGLDELTRCAVSRRIRLGGLLADARAVASYADGVPAIVARRLGRGRVLALTTSPDPQWSDLGVQAAGLLTWLHRLVDEALGPPTAVAQFTAGQSPLDPLPALPAGALVHVSVQGQTKREPTWVRLNRGVPQQPWPTDVAGLYTVRSGGGESTALYAVNWPAEESDLTPIDRDGLVRALGTEVVTLEAGDQQGEQSARWPAWLRWLRDPGQTLGLMLLVLFVAEMAFAARRSGARQSALSARP